MQSSFIAFAVYYTATDGSLFSHTYLQIQHYSLKEQKFKYGNGGTSFLALMVAAIV